ncbi:hypothetical protein EVAR_47104_1 [Eumeta japonica]|uniref:Uncharacterized protein n=1 Tax=Eumeta variegata TaxID=151549 RepID=A0A4C1Y973_EUMVA|nr:hypothetical protein EVAR_47104_1 [Eumeta japonica]
MNDSKVQFLLSCIFVTFSTLNDAVQPPHEQRYVEGLQHLARRGRARARPLASVPSHSPLEHAPAPAIVTPRSGISSSGTKGTRNEYSNENIECSDELRAECKPTPKNSAPESGSVLDINVRATERILRFTQ